MARNATVVFRVLLAEDDPISSNFLAEAMRSCGAGVTACSNGPEALARACNEAWDLLVFDHHLPGLDGDALLAALRANPEARSRPVPAVATSAEREFVEASLLAAGFAEVLPKPLSIGELRDALRRHGCPALDPLDDDDALRACGSSDTVRRLRQLFAEQELPGLAQDLDTYGDNPRELRPILHRLVSSCGFCGATTLASASTALQLALAVDPGNAAAMAAMDRFRAALAETRAALQLRIEA